MVNLVELLTKQCLISFPEKQEIQVKALPANPGLLCGGCCVSVTVTHCQIHRVGIGLPAGVSGKDAKGDAEGSERRVCWVGWM